METQSEEACKQNTGLEFNSHVCLQCKSCVEGLDQYVSHINNGCFTAEEDEHNVLEDFKKKEHQLKKELSALKMNVVEKEGQLKDIQNKILRHERTGHKVKTAQLKIKSEEVVISKKEMKQLKLKYNKLLCYLKEHEHEIDQTEKKGDTPEKINDQKSPKVEKKSSYSKITSIKFADKNRSPEKRREISKEKNRLIIQDSLFKKTKKDKKEQTNVTDSGRHLLENHSSKLSCSETVSTNLKESSVVGINPKHSKTNKNELIKDDKFSFTNKMKHGSNKPEKSPILEPTAESTQFLDTQDELSPVSLLMNLKQNIAGKAKDSLDLYRKTDKSCGDTTNEAQSSCYKNEDDGIKTEQCKDKEKKSDKPMQPILKNTKSLHSNSQHSTIEFTNSQQSSTTVDNEVDNGKTTVNLENSIKPILKSRVALSKDSECPTNAVKVENVTHRSPIYAKNSNSNNESVVFLKQIQLPPNNEVRVVPRVSTPICKEEKLDFVDPELSAIISGDEVSHGVDESVYLLSAITPENPKESVGHTPLNKKSPEPQKEFEGFTSNKKKKMLTERVKDKVTFKDVSFEQKLKDQAKDESHNEAMILETDLDNEVCKIDNSDQCLDNTGNVSIYSPRDPVETLSLTGSEFLTVSEATKSPTKADKSINCDSENEIDSGKIVGSNSTNDMSKSDKNEKSDTLKKDVESNCGKSSEFIPLSEKTQGHPKVNDNIEKRSDNLDNSDKVEKLSAATGKSVTVKTIEFTSISKGSSGSQKQKITMEKMVDKVEKSENIEKLPTATVKPLNTASTKLPNDETSRRDKRKLHPEGSGSTEKRTRINSSNSNDGVWHPSNYRRGGSNSAIYQGDRYRPSYDPNHHPRPGVLRVPYQRPTRPPWQPRGTNNYRPRMHNQNHYNYNYRW